MHVTHQLRAGVAALMSSLALLFSAAPAQAAEPWPSKPVRIVVGFPAGSNGDVLMRLLAEPLSKALGQPVIVDPHPGAAGNLASQMVAASPPDGYTLMLGTNATQAINPSLYTSMRLDTQKAFAAVTLICDVPNVLVIAKDVPATNVAEFIAYVRSRPTGEVNYGSSGNGGAMHLAGELFKERTKLDMTHVPYKGSPPAMTDLMAGRIQAIFQLAPAAVSRIDDPRLKIIGVTSKERLAAIPNVPTLSESGLPGFEVSSWHGIFAPANTPPEIINRLNREIGLAIKEGLGRKFEENGAIPRLSSPQQLTALVAEDIDRWRTIVRRTGARVD